MQVLDAPKTTIIRLGEAERMLVTSDDRISLFGSDHFYDQVLEDLRWEGVAHPRLLSFDIFDTVLLRRNISELRRFVEVAEALTRVIPGLDPLELLVARLTATRASYRTDPAVGGYREGRIEDIHRLSLGILGRGPELAQDMVDVELSYEATQLVLNPLVPRLIARFEESQVVGASNMYLSGEHVSRLLRAAGAPEFPVWTSTDQRMSKNDGRLLRLVAREFDVSGDDCLHIGDSFGSDFAPAKRLGWHAMLWPIPDDDAAERKRDAIACVEELERRGLPLGSLAKHFVENP